MQFISAILLRALTKKPHDLILLLVGCLWYMSLSTATPSPTPTQLPSQTPTQPSPQTTTLPTTGPPPVSDGSNAGAIAGGVIGGLLGVVVIVLIIIVVAYLIWRVKDSPSKCDHCYHCGTFSVHMYVALYPGSSPEK